MKEKEKQICIFVKTLLEGGRYDEAYERITNEIKAYPDSAVGHNLLGILYEKQHSHINGMKHFRAAWALDPTFLPARWNMDLYGSIGSEKKACAFVEEDCTEEIRTPRLRVIYDKRGIGHFEPVCGT